MIAALKPTCERCADDTPLPWPLAMRLIFLACGMAWAALAALVVS